REHLANDPLNPAVDGSLNQSNGDGDAATWLPPNEAIRCDLVAQQVAVKGVYRLWVTTAEADAVSRVLGACPDEVLPTIAQWVTPATS
ncbi:MAG: calcium-binding protein, partial [Ornithinimicrobium sp.]